MTSFPFFQALIKMEENGSFFLKNIGKSSIFLNGKEVATGHRVCLSSSCLIEVIISGPSSKKLHLVKPIQVFLIT